MVKPVISVFGSSRPAPESDAYLEARQLGTLLAKAGFAVATGGYGGTMAAVSQGASEAGGRVIGVTSNHMEKWRPMPRNEWVGEEIRLDSQRDRLLYLVMNNVIQDRGTAVLVLGGFAAVQIIVHMVYFLHMNGKIQGGWTMLSTIFTVVFVAIAIAGTLWVMFHMNTNMMPMHPDASTHGTP